MVTFYLDELKNGAGPGNHGADFAIFKPSYVPFQLTKEASKGEYRMSTRDWIRRGRPTQIEIDVPEEQS